MRNEQEMAEAIAAAHMLDSNLCREVARKRFSVHGTVERYFEVYRMLSNGEERPGGVEASEREGVHTALV